MFVQEPRPDPKWWQLFTVRLFVIGLSIRLLFGLAVITNGRPVELDSHDYLKLAQNLQEQQTFARDKQGQNPDLKRTPGYPSFLLLTQGSQEFPYLLLLAQSLLGTLSCMLILPIARQFEFSDRMGRHASWLLALDPLSITHCSLILSETLFATLVALWLLAFSKIWSTSSSKKWTLAMMTLASLATLTRPLGLFLVLPSLAAIIRAISQKRSSLPTLLLALLLGLLPLNLWMARNYYHSKGVILTSIGATNLLEYRAAGVKAKIKERPYLQVREELRSKYGDDDPLRSPEKARDLATLKTKVALEILKENPEVAAKQSGRGLLLMLLAPGAGSVLKSTGIHEGGTGIYSALSTFDIEALKAVAKKLEGAFLPIFLVTLLCFLFLAVLYGSLGLVLWRTLFELGARKRVFGLLFLASLLLVPAAGPESEPRFRVPVMIFLALAASPGLCRWFDWFSNLRMRMRPDSNEEDTPLAKS